MVDKEKLDQKMLEIAWELITSKIQRMLSEDKELKEQFDSMPREKQVEWIKYVYDDMMEKYFEENLWEWSKMREIIWDLMIKAEE